MTDLFRPARTAVLLACLFGNAMARAEGFLVQPLPISGKDTQGEPYDKGTGPSNIIMPFVKASAPSGEVAARRINELLFITLTGALPPRQPGTGFVVNGSDELTGTASQAFTVPRNDGRILTIDLTGEGCGAYCEDYTRQFSFEAATGRLLTPQNLFTPAGQRALAARVTAERVRQYREQISTQRAGLKYQQANPRKPTTSKAAKEAAEEITDFEDRIGLNESCLAELTDKSRQTATPPDQGLADYQQAAHPKSYDITAGRCSNHAMRALDDVAEVTLALPYAQLTPYLTPYGKAVLLGGPPVASAAAEPADPFTGQVLHGQMSAAKDTGGDGNGSSSKNGISPIKGTPVSSAIPITMLFTTSSGEVSGKYFYDRIGKPIVLSGTASGGKLELQEQIADKAGNAAVFKLARSGGALSGQWVGQKTFVVQLAP